ncbi:hypothetical protein [Brevibacillus laterosporus]|uniref:hypothetical protein n=1 Tax=Brevibacillus laterosporus TaxID=1465 RepID=UPI000E6BE5EF|nr:hypothetical protein [Brevibacillus laterosporus]AYB38542.1 hypothetical protein D5F52_09870 [Brevibacillus laterosporus]MBM7110723.1 hypothetical protein [Brevibacillus laterosporus]
MILSGGRGRGKFYINDILLGEIKSYKAVISWKKVISQDKLKEWFAETSEAIDRTQRVSHKKNKSQKKKWHKWKHKRATR